MRALDVPVHNTWGLRPAVVDGTKEIAPLTTFRDLDGPGLLDDVPTLNFHPHLPHYELTAPEGDGLRVLGRQRVDPHRPHPFTAAGNTEFNALIWMPPSGDRAGDIVLVDSTHFTTLFGGTDSLRNLWRNLARWMTGARETRSRRDEQADLSRFGDCRRAGCHAELSVDRGGLALRRFAADHQFVGDPLQREVGREVGQQP